MTDTRARLHAMFNLSETDEAELNTRIDTVVAAETAELRARVTELEAQAEQVAGFCGKRAEYVNNLRNCNPDNDHDYYRWTGHAEARRQLSQLLGLPVSWPPEDAQTIAPTSPEQKDAS